MAALRGAWFLLEQGPAPACTNMAVDHLLLERALLPGARPVLRLYSWTVPSVTVGYFQDLRRGLDLGAVERRGWPLVRRLTGGRAVLHDREVTYSVVLPPGASRGVKETYAAVAQALLAALERLGVRAGMEHRPRRGQGRGRGSPDCFASVSWCEIAVEGRKLVGSAQRRFHGAALQHGSILLDHGPYAAFGEALSRGAARAPAMTSLAEQLGEAPDRSVVHEALVQGFGRVFGARFQAMPWGPDEENAVVRLVRSRYGRRDWNLVGKASNS